MTNVVKALLPVIILGVGAAPLMAQDERRPVCFHPRPLDRCRAFPLYELTVTATALSSSVRGGEGQDFPPALTGTVGAMANVTQWLAVGAQLVHSPVQEFGNAQELRLRWWIGESKAFDASLGYGTSKHEEPFYGTPEWDGRTSGRGPTASLAFVPIEYLSFVVRARAVHDQEDQRRRGLMFGVQTGSWSAVGVTILGAGLIVAVFVVGTAVGN
jgi:hypothetical protein